MLREETRALMAQWRRSMSSRAAPLAGLAKVPAAAQPPAAPAAAVARQQRQHLNVTSSTSRQPLFPGMLGSASTLSPIPEEPVEAPAFRPHQLVRGQAVNGGRQVLLE